MRVKTYSPKALLYLMAVCLASISQFCCVSAQTLPNNDVAVTPDTPYAREWLKQCSKVCVLSHSVERARVFVVPDSKRDEAIKQLQDQSAVLLSDEELKRYLGSQAPTGDEVLDKAIADPSVETGSMPGDLAASDDVLYLKTLRGKLQPYLVRAVVANNGNYTFRVGWYGNDLGVASASLGQLNFYRRPLIVFLEAKPENVLASAIAAV